MSNERHNTTALTIHDLLAGRNRDHRSVEENDDRHKSPPLNLDAPVGPSMAEAVAPATPGIAGQDQTTTERRATNRARRNESTVIKLALPPMPVLSRQRSYITLFSFLLFVLLPALLGASYYLFVASDQYVAEFRFAVQESRAAAQANSPPTMPAGLAGLGGASSTALENYIVADYITSRKALEDLQSRIDLRALYTRSDVDWLSRLSQHSSMEKFEKYWGAW